MYKFRIGKGEAITYYNEINYDTMTLTEINEALSYLPVLIKSHILSDTDVEKRKEALMNAKQQKIIDTYVQHIWQTKDGTWIAYVHDKTKKRGRRPIQDKCKENLEKKIIDDYIKRFDDRLVFSIYFANWLVNYKATVVKPSTIQRNFNDYRRYIKGSKLDKMKITDIKRKDMKEFLNDFINKNKPTRKCLNNLKSIFNGLFTYALDCEDITVNPMANLTIENTNIKQEAIKRSETEVFNEKEFDALMEYMYENYRTFRPVVSLAILLNFQLGLRVGELCALKKTDIDFNNYKIYITRTEVSYRPIRLEDGKIVEEKTIHEVTDGQTKKDSNRIIDLSDEAVAIIKEAMKLQKELGIKSDFLFADENGNHIIRQRINDCLREYCYKLSLECKSSHKVRKTVLSNLFANGFDLEEVMLIAGHRNKSTTFKYYLFSIKMKDDKRARLNGALCTSRCTFGQPMVDPQKIA